VGLLQPAVCVCVQEALFCVWLFLLVPFALRFFFATRCIYCTDRDSLPLHLPSTCTCIFGRSDIGKLHFSGVRKFSCSLSLRSLFPTAERGVRTAVGGVGAQHWTRRGWLLTSTGRNNSCCKTSLYLKI